MRIFFVLILLASALQVLSGNEESRCRCLDTVPAVNVFDLGGENIYLGNRPGGTNFIQLAMAVKALQACRESGSINSRQTVKDFLDQNRWNGPTTGQPFLDNKIKRVVKKDKIGKSRWGSSDTCSTQRKSQY
jgi:hypothetical protein